MSYILFLAPEALRRGSAAIERLFKAFRAYPQIKGMPIVRQIFCQTRRFSAYRAVACQTGPVRQGKATQYGRKYAVQAVCP